MHQPWMVDKQQTALTMICLVVVLLIGSAFHYFSWFLNARHQLMRRSLRNSPFTDVNISSYLETEIRWVSPAVYQVPHSVDDLLHVRSAFPEAPILRCYLANGSTYFQSVGSTEEYALRYDYDTAPKNCTKPMIPEGVASFMDWALMLPILYAPNVTALPTTIFVHTYMLTHFVEHLLPLFEHRRQSFVLVSAGSDYTIPRNTDQRYSFHFRGFGDDPSGGRYYQRLITHPLLLRWFCENHDGPTEGKLETLPTGIAYASASGSRLAKLLTMAASKAPAVLQQRPLRIFYGNRVRTAVGQWQLRGQVFQWCKAHPLCHSPTASPLPGAGITHNDFTEHVLSASFVACVHGGGLDPSPCAWEAVVLGTIPIIQSSTLDDAYQLLPLLIVRDWHQFLDRAHQARMEETLTSARRNLAPFYEPESDLRQQVLKRTRMTFWIERIRAAAANHPTNLPSNATRKFALYAHEL